MERNRQRNWVPSLASRRKDRRHHKRRNNVLQRRREHADPRHVVPLHNQSRIHRRHKRAKRWRRWFPQTFRANKCGVRRCSNWICAYHMDRRVRRNQLRHLP